ncbi:MAG: dimethyl sulfoxide reductase anchor subunit [Verrucomicrobiales bacterium]|nr:dimethyl sulfoxide reductase anchor subunit [Verrucomicrobiales bacterium]
MPPAATPSHEATTLIDELLAQERNLTAVDRFSQWHGRQTPSSDTRPASRLYRSLLPLHAPGPGEQYAFEVDLDRCSGCKACVTACHALNGLEDGESWRSVGLLVGAPPPASPAPALLQHVTAACHHCLEPACLHGCPVLAYEKDPGTGIVRHLDDQCIGCTYCIMMCPYEVPRFSQRLGIVRKCDLCSERLVAGEAPACVQACPTEAIRVTHVAVRDVRARLLPALPASSNRSKINPFLPSAPDPILTLPTTRYSSERLELASMRSVDLSHATPAHGHAPLVIMLVLSQAAVGVFSWRAWMPSATPTATVWLGLAMLVLALGASVLHLGQPRRAWRVFLGLRRSWLSREAILLGALLPAALAATVLSPESAAAPLAAGLAALLGWASIGASTMVYAATGRPYWSAAWTASRFVGCTLALGSGLVGALSPLPDPWLLLSTLAGLLGAGLSLAPDLMLWTHRCSTATTALARTAFLLSGRLRFRWRARLGLAAAGMVALIASWLASPNHSVELRWIAVVCLFATTLLERHLFFTAASPDRMPGNVPA